MAKVFVSRELPIDLEATFEGHELVVFREDRPPSVQELVSGAQGSTAIVSLLSDRIDEAFLEQVPSLKCVANYAVGYDNVDLDACKQRGVWVTNTPDVLTESTAELTWALILACARRLREGERVLRAGEYRHWSPTMLLGTELFGRTLGIFGFGRIGGAVAKRGEAFGMRVLHTSRSSGVSFEQLLAESDVLSIHAPSNADTKHVFDKAAFSQMKPSAILVNTARGPLINEAELVSALEASEIAGAALDVYEHEPKVHPGLLNRDDVVLLPHLGSATKRARRRMAEIACTNALAALEGLQPPNLVNV